VTDVILFQSHLSRIVTPGWVMVITGKIYTDSHIWTEVRTVIGMRTMDVNKCMYYYYLILLEKFGLSVRQWYLLFVFSRLLCSFAFSLFPTVLLYSESSLGCSADQFLLFI
jgi:hypothetical protein